MATTDQSDCTYSREELEAKTVAELRTIASQEDVSVPSSATKSELIDALLEADAQRGAEGNGEAQVDDEPQASVEDQPRDDEPADEGNGAHLDQLGREADDGLGSADDQIVGVIDNPPASGGSVLTQEERTRRISAENIETAPKDQWIDYVQQGEDDELGDQNVQAAVVIDTIYLVWGDPDETKLEPGDYIVRDGNGDIRPVKKTDFQGQFAKPDTDVPGKEVQQHPAVEVLTKAIQLWIERPGDAENIAQIYAWADEAGVDLRAATDSGPSVKP